MDQYELDDVFERTKREFSRMSDAQQGRVTRSKQSFANWIRNKVSSIAENLGYAISFPFRVVGDLISGLWRGLFG